MKMGISHKEIVIITTGGGGIQPVEGLSPG